MTQRILYFAFGSNLHAPQMHARCPECEVLQPAVLEGYRLAFRGLSRRWGGGVATVDAAPGSAVPGLLYRLSPADLEALNGFESYPAVYGHLPVQVTARDGSRMEALTYQRLQGEPRPPSLRYFHQIWQGYRAHALDDDPLHEAVAQALRTARGEGTGG